MGLQVELKLNHHARCELGLDEKITIESILGACFTVRPVEETTFGPHKAIIPEVTGRASIIGRTEIWIDPEDPPKHGFMLK